MRCWTDSWHTERNVDLNKSGLSLLASQTTAMKHRAGSTMLWACFAAGGAGALHKADGRTKCFIPLGLDCPHTLGTGYIKTYFPSMTEYNT